MRLRTRIRRCSRGVLSTPVAKPLKHEGADRGGEGGATFDLSRHSKVDNRGCLWKNLQKNRCEVEFQKKFC